MSENDLDRALVEGLSFRLVQPEEGAIDVRNVQLSDAEEEARLRSGMHHLEPLPRMSTFAIACLIHRAVEQMPADQVYLNIGVWFGYTLFAGMAAAPEKRCIGVDNFSEFNGPRDAFLTRFARWRSPSHDFHEGDFRDYLNEVHRGSIGVYFYDGPHGYEDQRDALFLAEPSLAPGATIFVDDTNWQEPREATLDFLRQSSHRYRTVLDVRTAEDGHPTFWNGLMVLRKIS